MSAYIRLNPELTVNQIMEEQGFEDVDEIRNKVTAALAPHRMVRRGHTPRTTIHLEGITLPIEYFVPAYKHYYYGSDGIFIDTTDEKTYNSEIDKHSLYNCSNEQYAKYVPTTKLYRFKSLDEYDLKTPITEELEACLTYEYTMMIDPNTLGLERVRFSENCNIYCEDLEEVPLKETKDTRNPPVVWGPEVDTRVSIGANTLKESIRVRYAMFERPRNGLSNVILDSFVPRLMYKSNFNIARLHEIIDIPKTSVAISPWFASILGVKQISTEQLCRILGYSLKDIKLLLQKVKAKGLVLNMVGFGGTSVNTLHWLNEMMMMTNSLNLFHQVNIWEPDSVEISNLLRFPINPQLATTTYNRPTDIMEHIQSVPKTDLLAGELTRLSKNKPAIDRSYFRVGAYESPYRYDYDNRDEATGTTPYKLKNEKQIIYGAPDIATRQKLSEYGNFISATHSNTSCRVDLNPDQDINLQVESYGVISLSMFFMNQLRMSIALLELLGSDQDLQEKDKTILEYSFNGKRLLPTDREYNFQLEHSGLVFTEEEANANV